MSLGDYLRYERARRGLTLDQLAKALELTSIRELSEIEQRYRQVGSDELLEKIATLFAVNAEELRWHRARFRKQLSAFAYEAMQTHAPVTLHLRTGEHLTGYIHDWDLACLVLAPEPHSDTPYIVQRHAVIDWGIAT